MRLIIEFWNCAKGSRGSRGSRTKARSSPHVAGEAGEAALKDTASHKGAEEAEGAGGALKDSLRIAGMQGELEGNKSLSSNIIARLCNVLNIFD